MLLLILNLVLLNIIILEWITLMKRNLIFNQYRMDLQSHGQEQVKNIHNI
jgi:hypothetical protein